MLALVEVWGLWLGCQNAGLWGRRKAWSLALSQGYFGYWLWAWEVGLGILSFPRLRGLEPGEAQDWFVTSKGGLMLGAWWASWAS